MEKQLEILRTPIEPTNCYFHGCFFFFAFTGTSIHDCSNICGFVVSCDDVCMGENQKEDDE